MKKKINTIFISILLSIVLKETTVGLSYPWLEKWQEFSVTSDAVRMLSWAKELVMKELDTGSSVFKERLKSKFPENCPPFFGRLGIFVTVVKKGDVRGCYGAFYHRYNDLKSVLTSYIRGALRYDSRYRPVGIEEAGDVDIIITIASQPLMVNDLYSVDISRYGIILSLENGASMIFVPSEIKTHDYLKRKLGGRRTSGISAFRAVTIKAISGDVR